MVFQVKGRGAFKLRIALDDGRYATCSTGMHTREDADDVEREVERWKGRRGRKYARPELLEAIVVTKRITLQAAYQASLDGTLDARVAELLAAVQTDLDLRPLIEEWYTEKARAKHGAASADNYKRQLLRLFPERDEHDAPLPFTRSLFTRKEVWARLDRLDVAEPTKNRNKAAVSSFARFLLKRELLETNFTRDITGYSESDPRVVYYERADAQRLIAGVAQPYAGAAAFACGFCAEWCAIRDLLVQDLVLEEGEVRAFVRGAKRSWRRRWVPLVPENAWVLPYLRAAIAKKVPTARVFDSLTEWVLLDRQRATARALEITAVGEDRFGQHSVHDWRHTHVVQLLRDGYDEQIAAAHAGHKNVDLIRKVYGVFRPDRHDYARARERRAERDAATKSATTARNNVR